MRIWGSIYRETIKLPVSKGHVRPYLSGSGEPLDGGPRIIPEDRIDVNGHQ
jgi:V/A-type H+-transporting ATPase subunit B